MSSSSYQPEEDEEASDSDLEPSHANAGSPPQSAERAPSEGRQYAARRVSGATNQTREMAYWELRKRLTKESVKAYSGLLAETTSGNAATAAEVDSGENYNVTQNGIVIWTPKEKEILFNILDRKGKNGVKEIAEAIGSKSELEVQEHLRLLHRGLERQHLRDRHARTVVLGDVPVASEVRDQCGRVLDKHASLLSLEEEYVENVAGKEKHHDAWIIDQVKAEEIDDEIAEEEEEEDGGEEGGGGEENERDAEAEQTEGKGIATNSTVHLAASLLNMEKWTRLSERFFMNFGGPKLEDNWTNVAYSGESPSLTADAFSDFYALTLSVTRRLVQSSLFFATSRLRKMKNGGHHKAQIVRSRDVKTALDVLNMKRDRSDFWIGLARRCSLDVVDSRHKKGWKSFHVNHDEAEDFLSGAMRDDGTPERDVSKLRSGGEEHAVNDDDDESVLSDVRSSPQPQLYLSLEDEHAETVDRKTSDLEEQRLWQLLGRPAPPDLDFHIKPEDEDPEISRRPTGERKTKADLVDWRDRTLYRSEWEEYGNDIHDVYEEISENRRKRRRVAKEDYVRLASPASTMSEEDVEMDTDDGQEEIDIHAIKHEGDIRTEEKDDEAMDVEEDSVAFGEPNQQPIISRESQVKDSYEHPESDEKRKLARQAPQQRIKPGSEHEGSESLSESEGERPKINQRPNIGGLEDKDEDESWLEHTHESSEYSDSDEDSKPVVRASSPYLQRTKPGSGVASMSESEDFDNGTTALRRLKSEPRAEAGHTSSGHQQDLPFGLHQINPDY